MAATGVEQQQQPAPAEVEADGADFERHLVALLCSFPLPPSEAHDSDSTAQLRAMLLSFARGHADDMVDAMGAQLLKHEAGVIDRTVESVLDELATASASAAAAVAARAPPSVSAAKDRLVRGARSLWSSLRDRVDAAATAAVTAAATATASTSLHGGSGDERHAAASSQSRPSPPATGASATTSTASTTATYPDLRCTSYTVDFDGWDQIDEDTNEDTSEGGEKEGGRQQAAALHVEHRRTLRLRNASSVKGVFRARLHSLEHQQCQQQMSGIADNSDHDSGNGNTRGRAAEHASGAGACTTEGGSGAGPLARAGVSLSVAPTSGLIGRGQIIDLDVAACFRRRGARLHRLLVVHAPGGMRVPILVRGCGQLATFAVPPRDLPSALFVLEGSSARGEIAEATAEAEGGSSAHPRFIPHPAHPAPSRPRQGGLFAPARCDDGEQQVPPSLPALPIVLLELGWLFFELNGPGTEGIFRVSPEHPALLRALYERIDCGESPRRVFADAGAHADAHCAGSLIKLWFRQLPQPLFAAWLQVMLSGCEDESGGGGEDEDATTAAVGGKDQGRCGDGGDNNCNDGSNLVNALDSYERYLLLYLLDLLCAVIIRADVNRMTAQNCAIVLAPNLVGPNNGSATNPMQALEMSQKSVEILQALVERHLGECYTFCRDTDNPSESELEHGSVERKQQS